MAEWAIDYSTAATDHKTRSISKPQALMVPLSSQLMNTDTTPARLDTYQLPAIACQNHCQWAQ